MPVPAAALMLTITGAPLDKQIFACEDEIVADNADRIIGQLEGGFKALDNKLCELHRSLERIESEQTEARRRLHERVEETNQRITKLEPLIDTVDMHGDALTSIEDRLDAAELQAKLAAKGASTNRNWVKWIGGGVVMLIGDHFSGSKLAKWFVGLFGG